MIYLRSLQNPPLVCIRYAFFYPLLVRKLLLLIFLPCLGLPSSLFSSGFLTKNLYEFLFSAIHATCSNHKTIRYFTMVIIFGEEGMSWSFLLRGFSGVLLLRLKDHPQESILKLSHSMSFSEQTEFLLLKFNALQNPGVQFIYCTFFNKEKTLLGNMLSERCTGDCLNMWAVSGRMRILVTVMNVVSIIKVCLCLFYTLIAISMTNQTNESEVIPIDVFFSIVINLLKTKRNLLYIRNQSVPRSKHFPPRL